jgi:hypothetical protein
MIDFPATPTVGAPFISGGKVWIWDGAKWTANGLASSPIAGGGNANRIVNGDMRVDQRNGGGAISANNVYTVDRWRYNCSLGTNIGLIGQRLTSVAAPPGRYYYLGYQNATQHAAVTTDTCAITQGMEADLLTDFAWGTASAQPCTLSFWAWASVAGTYSGSLCEPTGARSYPFTYSIPVANIWTKIAVTIPGDPATGIWQPFGNSASVVLRFDLGCGPTFRGPANVWASANYVGATGSVNINATLGGTWLITDVKLELGTIATPFVAKPPQEALADCQRYFQIAQVYLVSQAGSAGQLIAIGTMAPVAMRAAATMTATTNASTNWTLTVLNYNAQNLIVSQGTATASGPTAINLIVNANADF